MTFTQQSVMPPTHEDKDFGLLAYAGGHETPGVLLIRYPVDARRSLARSVVQIVSETADRIPGAFIVIEPGRARLSRPRGQD